MGKLEQFNIDQISEYNYIYHGTNLLNYLISSL